jgi:hypothetical protein
VSGTNAMQEAFEGNIRRHDPRRSIRRRCWAGGKSGSGARLRTARAETIAAAEEGLGSNFVRGGELGRGHRRRGLRLRKVRAMRPSFD